MRGIDQDFNLIIMINNESIVHLGYLLDVYVAICGEF